MSNSVLKLIAALLVSAAIGVLPYTSAEAGLIGPDGEGIGERAAELAVEARQCRENIVTAICEARSGFKDQPGMTVRSSGTSSSELRAIIEENVECDGLATFVTGNMFYYGYQIASIDLRAALIPEIAKNAPSDRSHADYLIDAQTKEEILNEFPEILVEVPFEGKSYPLWLVHAVVADRFTDTAYQSRQEELSILRETTKEAFLRIPFSYFARTCATIREDANE